MSLSASLNNALTGLGLSSRRAEIIASNVANADTPGYARRQLVTSGTTTGVPAGRTSVVRDVDPTLQGMRRDAQAKTAEASVGQAFHTRFEAAIGDPDQSGSLQELLARLDASFTAAAADPTSATRLAVVSQSAQDLADKLNSLGDLVTTDRQATEGAVGDTVDRLNDDLSSVASLNGDIARMRATGVDPSNLLDQRQSIVDRIATDIPLRQLPRDNGGIALVSQGGVVLLDGGAAEIGYQPRTLIQPHQTYPDDLSGLTVNGRNVGAGAVGDGLAGGGLGGLFTLRDEGATTAMARLDAVAVELGARFQDPSVDPSLAGATAGLFTDAGARVDDGDFVGLSSRIAVNARVTPDQPSGHWHLRDGLGAVTPGSTSNQEQLFRFSEALGTVAVPVSSSLGDGSHDIAGLGARLRSAVSLDRVTADEVLDRSRAQETTLVDLRDGGAVDIDEEMRSLLEVEQAYAANARLIQAVGQMMDRLTEI
ncbi:flagellar basal body protein [Jannaschia sp. 2305UL9-9]|uniref:FlgK family flagellar hook-associated protein n=1 Tax=Jannaschia sp. 2305UL9-9 TaxID=3121638 RepID=UPI003529043C